ncbi:unnamed protein product [Protopolystoma xenopodis]|uniref:Uncharacterized protein n=1 Tax=Protopolystoma xenopodis TaxID=117903 RepID=A0A3S5BY61_9PLAT|nr:unnamed protein product [Protopolystoma xenopodis]
MPLFPFPAGLVPLVVARHLFGHYGQVALILICVMAITITGSAQIMAMTSIFIFDIHAVYIKVRNDLFASNPLALLPISCSPQALTHRIIQLK